MIYDFTIAVWFHGRGFPEKKPVASITRDDSWNYDHATLFAGTTYNPEKLVLLSEDNVGSTQSFSDIKISYDRWTHLAITWTKADSKPYTEKSRFNE